jgi:hypothetical protein
VIANASLTIGECGFVRSSESLLGPVSNRIHLSWLSDVDVEHLQDRLYWGLNRAANILGRVTDAYRSTGASDPIDPSNRYLQLNAAFSQVDGSFSRIVGYGIAEWRGYFDASYTRVGDYLVQGQDIWFIAEQQSLLPVLCVKTNRIISITRQLTPAMAASINIPTGNATINVISHWPVSMLGTGTGGMSTTQLPGDTTIPNWIALVPSVHEQVIQPTDIISDDLGITGIVVAAELSGLGWRLNVRQATT